MLKFTDVIGSRTSFIRRVSQVYFLKELCSQVAAIAWTHVTAQGQSFWRLIESESYMRGIMADTTAGCCLSSFIIGLNHDDERPHLRNR